MLDSCQCVHTDLGLRERLRSAYSTPLHRCHFETGLLSASKTDQLLSVEEKQRGSSNRNMLPYLDRSENNQYE